MTARDDQGHRHLKKSKEGFVVTRGNHRDAPWSGLRMILISFPNLRLAAGTSELINFIAGNPHFPCISKFRGKKELACIWQVLFTCQKSNKIRR